jgi:GNAT superfamily N-acetyltransferase
MLDDARELARLKIEWAGDSPTDAEVDEYASGLGDWISAQGDAVDVCVAVVDGLVVGMAWMVVFERVPDFGNRHRMTADIQSVYVTPMHRGLGLGRRLVEELCRAADARGVPRTVVGSSSGAVSLYEQVGFEHSPLLMQHPRRG